MPARRPPPGTCTCRSRRCLPSTPRPRTGRRPRDGDAAGAGDQHHRPGRSLWALPGPRGCAADQRGQLLGKPGGTGLPAAWAARHAGDVERIAAAGRRLRWSENWIRQVSRLAVPIVCLHAGVGLDGLRDEDFTVALQELAGAAYVSTSASTKTRTRLFAARQACYQLGIVAHPPRKAGPVAHTPAQLAETVRQPEVRREVV